MSKKYVDTIVKHYESCLEQYGDTHLGVDWPKAEDVNKRYEVMLDIINFRQATEKVSILDFGCGAAHLLTYMKDKGLNNISYSGLDISEKFINLCKSKYPDSSFYCLDILADRSGLPPADYVIMNGVFTEKREMSFEEMWDYFTKMLLEVATVAKKGIAFNVMSKAVDWEREDLFHVPADMLVNFLVKNISRDFVIRNDYGLYEYTVYIFINK